MIRHRIAYGIGALVLLVALVTVQPVSAKAHLGVSRQDEESRLSEADTIVMTAQPYIRNFYYSGVSLAFIDTRAAHDAGESAETLRVFHEVNTILSARSSFLVEAEDPMWGYWCVGNSKDAPPTDLLDRACLHRERCLVTDETDRDCEREFTREIKMDFSRMAPPAQRMAILMRAASAIFLGDKEFPLR